MASLLASQPHAACVCAPVLSPSPKAPSFCSVSCQNRAELLECLCRMREEVEEGGGFCQARGSVSKHSNEGKDMHCPLLHLLLQLPLLVRPWPCGLPLRGKSDQQANRKFVAGRRDPACFTVLYIH